MFDELRDVLKKFMAENPDVMNRGNAIFRLEVKPFKFKALQQAPQETQRAFFDLWEVQEGVDKLSDKEQLLRLLQDEIRGDHQAAEILREAKELLAIFNNGPAYRAGFLRALKLLEIWSDLGQPTNIDRDSLWRVFEEKYPELLEAVGDERKTKSRTFRDAGLEWLPTNKGGRSNR